MNTEKNFALEVSVESAEKKVYSEPKLVEYGELNQITESLHSLAGSTLALVLL